MQVIYIEYFEFLPFFLRESWIKENKTGKNTYNIYTPEENENNYARQGR